MRVKKTTRANHQNALFSWVFQGVFTSIFISLFFVFVVTMYTFFTDTSLSDGRLKLIFTVATLTSIFLGSLLAAHSLKKNGLILGAFVGGIYVGLTVLLNHFLNVNVGFEAVSALKIVICIGAGILGGVLGVNL